MADSNAIAERIQALHSRLADNEARQNELWQRFAQIRADSLRAGEISGDLTSSDHQMLELVEKRRAFGQEIERALRERDTARHERATALDQAQARANAAEAAYARLRADIQAELDTDSGYRHAAQAYEQARQTRSALETRLADARAERDGKHHAYENDPLFVYLLNRGYATQAYSRWGWARRIDDWIAGIVDFNTAYADYSLLHDMPDWLEENIQQVAKLQQHHEAVLAGYWQQLTRTAELRKRREEAEQARREARCQADDNAHALAREQALIDAGPEFEAGTDTYACQMHALYRRSFEQQPLPALRTLAAQTATELDEQAIDALAQLQAEHEDLSARLKSLETKDDPAT